MKTIKRKALISLLTLIILLSCVNVVAFALSESDITSTSPASGYYLPGNSISYSVTISGAANNPATVRVLYPYYTYGSQPRSTLCTLTRNGSTYNYLGSSTPSLYDWVPGRKPGSHSAWQTRGFCIEASKSGTTVTKNASGYITGMTYSDYAGVDSTFWYTNKTSNPFDGVGTPDPNIDSLTYNCLSYAVSVNTSWQWPWSTNPTQTQLDDYMAKNGSYASRPGDTFVPLSSRVGCDVIYYSDAAWGSGYDGHFARVFAWDASGNPTMIASKWGSAEIIESSSYNPFSGGTIYGDAKRYYEYG